MNRQSMFPLVFQDEHEAHMRYYHGATSFSVVYLSSALGEIMVESCDDCDLMVVICLHKKNTWDPTGTQLTCDLCGIDGT